MSPKLFESDSCSIWWDFDCGERGWTDTFLKYDVSGGPKSYTFIVSSAPQNTPKVVWQGEDDVRPLTKTPSMYGGEGRHIRVPAPRRWL